MKEFTDAIGAIGTNSDKLGAVGTLLLCFLGFLYALSKDILITGARYRELKANEQEYKEAAKVANAELERVKIALVKLQAEKDYGWQPKPRRARN